MGRVKRAKKKNKKTPQGTPNYVAIFMLSNMKGKMQKPGGECDMDSNRSSDDREDTKNVTHVWDFSSFLNSLADSGVEDQIIHKHVPLKIFSGHKDEGFAIDWSDFNKCIHLWEPTSSDWNIDTNPFVGLSKSVEDLQWSPTEANVFASSSADKTIAIWDIRTGKKPLANRMIASGSDDGSVSVHDYRLIKGQKHWKEVHWHSQIPGMIVATGIDGLDVLMPNIAAT
nr:unnamed protein product [Digitaria exilis]